MRKILRVSLASCLGLIAAINCFAQVYSVTDLGALGGQFSAATGINASGQVVGYSSLPGDPFGDSGYHAFRTAANQPINPATDDLGTLGGQFSAATGINASGQVVGYSSVYDGPYYHYAFRTAANSTINPATDYLGTLRGMSSQATAINNSGQVVGFSDSPDGAPHAFRTAANSPINPATDELGSLGGGYSVAKGINASGQVVGWSLADPYSWGGATERAFRTAANSPIDPATDDLGSVFGGLFSYAEAVSDSGQVVGYFQIGGGAYHAFRTAANSRIDEATDDLGTLGGTDSRALAINASGQAVGFSFTTGNAAQHAFLHTGTAMHDLNDLTPAGSGWELVSAEDINDTGQIVGYGKYEGQTRAFLLTLAYKAFVQPPLNADGSAVFSSNRDVVPVKFTLTRLGVPTCTLPAATISVTAIVGEMLVPVDEFYYRTTADSGSDFRIDLAACQYVYNIQASSLALAAHPYRVEIAISGIVVGEAVFGFQ